MAFYIVRLRRLQKLVQSKTISPAASRSSSPEQKCALEPSNDNAPIMQISYSYILDDSHYIGSMMMLEWLIADPYMISELLPSRLAAYALWKSAHRNNKKTLHDKVFEYVTKYKAEEMKELDCTTDGGKV